MTIKIYFLNSTLGEFPANPGDTRDEHTERLHQDIKFIRRGIKVDGAHTLCQITVGDINETVQI